MKYQQRKVALLIMIGLLTACTQIVDGNTPVYTETTDISYVSSGYYPGPYPYPNGYSYDDYYYGPHYYYYSPEYRSMLFNHSEHLYWTPTYQRSYRNAYTPTQYGVHY